MGRVKNEEVLHRIKGEKIEEKTRRKT